MKRNIILAGLVLLLVTGCKKFLDVHPINKVFEEELFQDRSGFETALADVYYGMGRGELYGRELKFGLMDAMCGYWTISASHRYADAVTMKFDGPLYLSGLDSIWSGLYRSINKINHILKNIDKIESDEYYNVIRGEALGLRAYLHLELLRLFGPVIKEEGADAKAIPYYREVRNTPQAFSTAKEVLKYIEDDLDEAETLLKEDPVIQNGREGDGNGYGSMKYNSLIDRRGNRMNYFAVLALKARKSMWEGNLTEAFKRAELVVNQIEPSFRLVNNADMASSYQRNKRFTPENIFGLYVRNQLDYLQEYLPPVTQAATISSRVLLPQYSKLASTLYKNDVHGSPNDYRLLNWFAPTTGNQYRFVKLNIDPLDETYLSQFEVQMINLPEMYYIMAEAKAETAPAEAMNILNELRTSRNLTTPIPYTPGVTTSGDVLNYIVEECRKDYIGEGYMYLMYKRMYHAIERPSGTVQPSLDVFRFPVPNDEGTYNNASK